MSSFYDQCWTELDRHQSNKGYTSVSRHYNGESLIHRAVFLALFGFLPEAVMHKCDNPPCFNPTHLQEGTVLENNHDMVRKGRNSPPPSNKRNEGMPDQRVDKVAYNRERSRRQEEGTWIYRDAPALSV